MKDSNGQPLRPFPLNHLNNQRKSIDQLIGLSKGILADGVVNDAEAVAFRAWIEEMPNLEWPLTEIRARIAAMFADGLTDEEERAELADIMRQLAGIGEEPPPPVENTSTALPLDYPPPAVLFDGAEFCVTGKFAFGKRTLVEEAIAARGGVTADQPRSSTDFLLIGTFASRDWVHTSYGRKIERAVELRDKHGKIAIIAEHHWADFL